MTEHLVKVVRRTCERVSRYYAHRLRDWQDVERVGKLSEDLQLARKLLRQVEAHNLHGKHIGQASGSPV